MYRSFDVANLIVKFAKKDRIVIEPLKLIKLVYLTHGWYLGFNNRPLISDSIEASKFGINIPNLNNLMKRFQLGFVDSLILELYKEKSINKNDKHFIKLIWNRYKNLSNLELYAITNSEKTPWATTLERGLNRSISNADIKMYYFNKIMENQKVK